MTAADHPGGVRRLYRLLFTLVLVGGGAAAWWLPGIHAGRESAFVIPQPVDRDSAMAMLDAGREVERIVREAAADTLVRHDIHGLDLLGWGLFRAGRAAEAVPLARRVMAFESMEPLLRYHAGIIECAAGDREAARRHLEIALRGRAALTDAQIAEARAALESIVGGR